MSLCEENRGTGQSVDWNVGKSSGRDRGPTHCQSHGSRTNGTICREIVRKKEVIEYS